MEYTPSGEDLVQKKPAKVVYAISLIAKIPYIVRDDYEEAALMEQLRGIGYRVVSMDIEIPINFSGWYFPRPLKRPEPSIN